MSQNKQLANGQLSSLLVKEMNRADFLKYMGAVVIGIFGVSALIRTLLQGHQAEPTSSSSPSMLSYGQSPYGGDTTRH